MNSSSGKDNKLIATSDLIDVNLEWKSNITNIIQFTDGIIIIK